LLNRISILSSIGTNTLIGVVERKKLSDGSEGNYNSSFLLNRKGNLSGVYRKEHLVL